MKSFTQSFVFKSFSQRIIWIRRAFIIVILILILRSLQLQIFDRPWLEVRAERQHNQSISIKLQRGPIYDRDGNILAVSLPLDSIYAIPAEIEDPEEAARIISPILNEDETDLYKKLTAKVSFTWLLRNAKPSTSQQIRKLQVPGLSFLTEYQRFYPLKNHAAQLIGFSGIDSQGLEGLEYQYNDHLMDGSFHRTIWSTVYRRPNIDMPIGGSLVLTIDNQLQYFAEKELRASVKGMRAKFGVVVIMETQTGNILTIANIPDYDPNNFEKYEQANYFNRAISATYEPGSTFKVVTIATALDNEIVADDNIFFCENGEYQIQDRVIHDIDSYGWLPLKEIVQKSSNICAAKIGQIIPKPVFYKYIRDFGFGAKTAIGLPGEASGKVFDYQNWSDTDVATISFGHTISATPIQVITAINSIATGGLLIKPHIIKEAKDANGKIVQLSSTRKTRILKEETAKTVKEYMVSVTQSGGTGVRARVAGVTIAGKTGTSEKFDRRKKEYSKKIHTASFVGFFPAEAPRLTILVIVDEPQVEYLGSKSATTVFRKVAEHAIQLYPRRFPQIEQMEEPVTKVFKPMPAMSKQTPSKTKSLENIPHLLKNKTLREILAIADRENFKVHVNGSGTAHSIRKSIWDPSHYVVDLR